MYSASFLLKEVPERKEWPKILSEKSGVSYTNQGKKSRDAVPACVHLRKNFRKGVPSQSTPGYVPSNLAISNFAFCTYRIYTILSANSHYLFQPN
jgi:hypothetical protein